MSLFSVMKLFGIRREGFGVLDGPPHLVKASPLPLRIILPSCLSHREISEIQTCEAIYKLQDTFCLFVANFRGLVNVKMQSPVGVEGAWKTESWQSVLERPD